MGIVEFVLIERELGVDQIEVFLHGVFGAGGGLGELGGELSYARGLRTDARFQIHQTFIQIAGLGRFGRRIFLGVFEGRGKGEVDGVVCKPQRFPSVPLFPVTDREKSQLLRGIKSASIDELIFVRVANRVHVEPARRIGPTAGEDGRGQRRDQQDQ